MKIIFYFFILISFNCFADSGKSGVWSWNDAVARSNVSDKGLQFFVGADIFSRCNKFYIFFNVNPSGTDKIENVKFTIGSREYENIQLLLGIYGKYYHILITESTLTELKSSNDINIDTNIGNFHFSLTGSFKAITNMLNNCKDLAYPKIVKPTRFGPKFKTYDIGPSKGLFFDGNIVDGDEISFQMAIKEINPTTVLVNSTGGRVYIAMNIANILRDNGIHAQTQKCSSACVYLFAGGVTRTVDRNATIKVHSAKYENADATTPFFAQKLVADIYDHLDELGIDPTLGHIAARVPNDKWHVLNREELMKFRIATEIKDLQ